MRKRRERCFRIKFHLICIKVKKIKSLIFLVMRNSKSKWKICNILLEKKFFPTISPFLVPENFFLKWFVFCNFVPYLFRVLYNILSDLKITFENLISFQKHFFDIKCVGWKISKKISVAHWKNFVSIIQN